MESEHSLEEELLGLAFEEITDDTSGMLVVGALSCVVQDARPIYLWVEERSICFVMETRTGRIWVDNEYHPPGSLMHDATETVLRWYKSKKPR